MLCRQVKVVLASTSPCQIIRWLANLLPRCLNSSKL